MLGKNHLALAVGFGLITMAGCASPQVAEMGRREYQPVPDNRDPAGKEAARHLADRFVEEFSDAYREAWKNYNPHD